MFSQKDRYKKDPTVHFSSLGTQNRRVPKYIKIIGSGTLKLYNLEIFRLVVFHDNFFVPLAMGRTFFGTNNNKSTEKNKVAQLLLGPREFPHSEAEKFPGSKQHSYVIEAILKKKIELRSSGC